MKLKRQNLLGLVVAGSVGLSLGVINQTQHPQSVIAATTTASRAVISGVNGTAKWDFDPNSGELRIHAGKLLNTSGRGIATWGEHFDTEMKTIIFDGTVTTNIEIGGLFSRLYSLTSFQHLDYLDVSQVMFFDNLFGDKTDNSKHFALRELDLNGWNVRQAVSFKHMFSNLDSLTSLKFDKWQTISVTNTSYMFAGTPNLHEIGINPQNGHLVTNMEGMFRHSGIRHLDLSHWTPTNVKNIKEAFADMPELETLKLNSIGTSTQFEATGLFNQTPKLWKLTLGVNYQGRDWATGLAMPAGQHTAIPGTPEGTHYNERRAWQAVGIGNIYRPTGTIFQDNTFVSEPRNGSFTHVWAQTGADIAVKLVDQSGKELAHTTVPGVQVGATLTAKTLAALMQAEGLDVDSDLNWQEYALTTDLSTGYIVKADGNQLTLTYGKPGEKPPVPNPPLPNPNPTPEPPLPDPNPTPEPTPPIPGPSPAPSPNPVPTPDPTHHHTISKMTVRYIVQYQGAGKQTPKRQIQSVQWLVDKDDVTGVTTYTPAVCLTEPVSSPMLKDYLADQLVVGGIHLKTTTTKPTDVTTQVTYHLASSGNQPDPAEHDKHAVHAHCHNQDKRETQSSTNLPETVEKVSNLKWLGLLGSIVLLLGVRLYRYK